MLTSSHRYATELSFNTRTCAKFFHLRLTYFRARNKSILKAYLGKETIPM